MFVRAHRILLVRLGPINAQRQTPGVGYRAPVGRGMWAFPYPHHDAFFYWHRWDNLLPKRLKDPVISAIEDPEARDAAVKEQEAKLREIRKRERVSKFWHGGPLYSRIPHPGQGGADWYLWESPEEWAKASDRSLTAWVDVGLKRAILARTAADHLEVFIPMQAGRLPATA